MDRRVLVSPLGFTPEFLLVPTKEMDPQHVVILHTKHPKALTALGKVKKELAKQKVSFEDIPISPDFDFVSWYQSLTSVVERLRGDEITLNLRPGHGIAIAMCAMVAAHYRLPCVYYDEVGGKIHSASPGILMQIDDLVSTDKKILSLLETGARSVGEVAEQTDQKLTTVSVALKRLQEGGWLERAKEQRVVTYKLRPGVREFLETILGGGHGRSHS